MVDYKFDINTNEYLPLRDVVFNTLRDAILSWKLLPGERLMENQLAEKLGVSRTPIREALRMLELENLVELVPRKGAQVLDMSEKDIKNVLEIRCALEALAVGIACIKMNDEQLQSLKNAQSEFIESCDKKEYEKASDADEKFHDIIFEATENSKLIQIINNLRIQLYRYRLAFLKVPNMINAPIEEHKLIIESIESHGVDKGSAAAAAHINHQSEVILDSIRSKKRQE